MFAVDISRFNIAVIRGLVLFRKGRGGARLTFKKNKMKLLSFLSIVDVKVHKHSRH